MWRALELVPKDNWVQFVWRDGVTETGSKLPSKDLEYRMLISGTKIMPSFLFPSFFLNVDIDLSFGFSMYIWSDCPYGTPYSRREKCFQMMFLCNQINGRLDRSQRDFATWYCSSPEWLPASATAVDKGGGRRPHPHSVFSPFSASETTEPYGWEASVFPDLWAVLMSSSFTVTRSYLHEMWKAPVRAVPFACRKDNRFYLT